MLKTTEATKLTIMAKRNQFPSVCLHQSGIHMKKELPSFFSKNFKVIISGSSFLNLKSKVITCYPKLYLWATHSEPPSVNLILSLVTFFPFERYYSIPSYYGLSKRLVSSSSYYSKTMLAAHLLVLRRFRRPQPLVCTSEHEDKSIFSMFRERRIILTILENMSHMDPQCRR